MKGKNKNKAKNKSWKSLLKRLFFWFFATIFLLIVLWVLFFSDYTKLAEIEIHTNKIDENYLNEIANNYRNEFFFDKISKNNFFLFPRNSFERDLMDKFEKIKKVNLKNNFPDSIIVDIKERKMIIILCSQEKCFLVDETGQLFYEIKEEEKGDRFKEYKVLLNQSLFELQEDSLIEDKKIIELVNGLDDLLKKEIGIEIERNIETPALISKELRIKTKAGWQIYFNTEIEILDQIGILREILKSSINKREKEQLEYIDLRILNKAIYRSTFKGENLKDENDDLKINEKKSGEEKD